VTLGDIFFPQREDRLIALPARRWRVVIAGIIYAVCAALFLIDLRNDVPWAFGVFYIPLVCTAVFYRQTWWVWCLTAIASAMVVVGVFVPVTNFSEPSLVNRSLSIGAILITAVLVRTARTIQDRLAIQTLRAQAADRMKSQIFANLSHELRTPLNAIIGFSEVLASNCRADQRSSVQHLHAAGRRLLATIDNLLDLTRPGERTWRIERLDLGSVLRPCIENGRRAAAELGISFETSLEPRLAGARGDSWAVRRIMDNLIDNAVKFTPAGGRIRIATETDQDRVFVIVQDNGPGMSRSVLDRLGEPFFQAESGLDRSFQGMGMGLALSYKLASSMGARLEFASAPGAGTTARLGLPLVL
jgi:signal transduction histidine kinase